MIILIVTLVLFAHGAGSEVSSIPGDNSNYVEGESRYIWIPDGNEEPHLQDLQAPLDETVVNARSGVNNEYWLFTRRNRDTPQVIEHGNVFSIYSSNYKPNVSTKFIIHGWRSSGYSTINTLITAAFLETQDCNIFVVDWRALAYSNYYTASYGVTSVGQALGNFLLWLHYITGMDLTQLHLVGFSLGAHAAATAGRICNGRPARITGLDPAGPLWVGSKDAINKDAARYVEIIHTDAGILGMPHDVGHVDCFPNGGSNPQPGCWLSPCSHARAYQLFASSVYYDHFVCKQCANLTEAKINQCNGSNFKMGNGLLYKNGNGIYAIKTGSSWPF